MSCLIKKCDFNYSSSKYSSNLEFFSPLKEKETMSYLIQKKKCSSVHLFEIFSFVVVVVVCLPFYLAAELKNPCEMNEDLKKILAQKEDV